MGERSSQRFDDWQQQLATICGRFDVRPPASGASFTGYAGRLDFGGLEIARIRSNATSLARSRQRARQESEYCFLVLQIGGHQHILANGNESIELREGELALIDSSTPFEMIVHGRTDNLSVHLPRRLLAQRLQRRHITGKLNAERANTQLMGAMLTRMRDIDPAYRATVGEGDAFRAALLDMLPTTLHESSIAHTHDAGSDLYRSACALIAAQLQQRHLEPGWIAEQLTISRRQLYRLFADHGEFGVARFILDRRLDRAAALLRDQRCQGLSISDLAELVGLSDHGHFSRAFRRRFSLSPSHYRDV